jgi:hypothetical protein
MRRNLMVSTAVIGLMLASSWAYAQAPSERRDEPKRTEEPAKGATQHGQGPVQERAHGAQERTSERGQGAADREQKGSDRHQATEERNHPSSADEHNRSKASDQTQGSRESAHKRNREDEGAKQDRENGRSNAETKPESGAHKSTAESEKSKKDQVGQQDKRKGAAANENEHNQGQTSGNTEEKQPPSRQGKRPATAETNRSPSTNNVQNAPSATGAQTNEANRTNNNALSEHQSRLNSEKQVRISETLSRKQLAPPERDLNISIRVGESVPPRVHLNRLPPEIVSIEPEYRDYDYFTTDDDIVIVEPDSHRIVSEVPRDPSRARAQLSGGARPGGASSMADASGANLNCKIMRRDSTGNVTEIQPSTVGSNTRQESLSIIVQLPGGGSSAPIALGASAGDIAVATQGQSDCTVTLEPQPR